MTVATPRQANSRQPGGDKIESTECRADDHAHLVDGTYPVHLDLSGRPVLVVGAGPVGARKAQGLVAAGAAVTIVAPEISPGADELSTASERTGRPATIHRRPYQRGEAASYRLVITATNEPAVNHQVFRDCEAAGIWCNSADDLDNCSFILAAVTRRDPVTITVGSNGVSPALASWLNRRIAAQLPDELEALSSVVATVRAEIKQTYPTTEAVDWATALDANADTLLNLIAAGREADAEQLLRDALRPFEFGEATP